jgi:hypothetical protein
MSARGVETKVVSAPAAKEVRVACIHDTDPRYD